MATEPTKLSYKSLIEWARTSGNGIKADSATTANKATLADAALKLFGGIAITLIGDVKGQVYNVDGSQNITISTEVAKIPTSMPNTPVSGSIWIES